MPLTRTTLLAGPAAVIFNGHTLFAHDGILVTPALELSVVDSAAQGVLDATVAQTPVTIKFTPSAPFPDLLGLYPWLDGAPGTSLFGAADTPLVLIAANGVRLTFSAVALIVMPDLLLTTRGPVAGAVTFLALGARTQPLTAANRWLTIDTAELPALPTGTPALADDFAITWGAAPWTSLRARDGVRLHFTMTTKPVFSDANALLDLTLERLEVEARFLPASPNGPAEEDVIAALQMRGGLPGRLVSATAQTLDIAGEHLWLRLPSAYLMRGELVFDAVRDRLGELTFVAERAFIAPNMAEALASLTEGAP